MNVAIIGTNCVVEALIQRFSAQSNVSTIYTYELPGYMCDWPKVINTSMSGNYRDFWLREAGLMKDKQLDLIIATGLIPQLWRELHYALKKTGVPLLIPAPEAAYLEWSKARCKSVIKELGIPTPAHEVISYNDAVATFKSYPRPYVLKYDEEYRDGLQTIIITDDNVDEQYDLFVSNGQTKASPGFTPKNNTHFVREQFIKGREYSYHVLCNGTSCTFLGAARDYKKRYENDRGYNTVGMGAYSPVDYIDHRVLDYAKQIVSYLNARGILYTGIMYLGIMVDECGNHNLLEVNTRFGDPEFSSILPTIETDLLQLFVQAATNKDLPCVEFNDGVSLSMRFVHKDYGLADKDSSVLPTFVGLPDDITVANSSGYKNFGPMVTTIQESLSCCADKLYDYVQSIDTGDFVYRKDVGYLK